MPIDDDYGDAVKNPPVGPVFHWRDGWYFQRTELGAVLMSTPAGLKVIPPMEWKSIVDFVTP